MAAGAAALPETFRNWFAARGWAPRAHQLDLLAKAQAGRSTLLIAPTGAGKTLAGFLPTLVELSEGRRPKRRAEPAGRTPPEAVSPLHTLYISPLKALAVDIARNLETPIREMELPIRWRRAPATPPPPAASGSGAIPRHPSHHAGAARLAAGLEGCRASVLGA